MNPETDFTEDRFGRAMLLVGPRNGRSSGGFADGQVPQGRPIIAFAASSTMNDAETLAGADAVAAGSRRSSRCRSGTYYRHDLVGCEVRDRRTAWSGEVTAVEGSLDRSYLVVDGDMMIPLVDGICVEVDMAARRIMVQPPEGLIDLIDRDGRVDRCDAAARTRDRG